MDKIKITYWASTGLFSAMMFMSASFYFFQNAMATEAYVALGYPTHLIAINGAAKVLGAVALLGPQFKLLKEWAYAGFTYLLGLGVIAHLVVGDGQWMGATIALVLLAVSYYSYKKMKK